MIGSCYHLPAARWHRKRTVPPAAGIRLPFQSLKGGLINSIIHSFTFMAQPDAARQGNVPPLTHLDRLECVFAGSRRGSLAARCTSLHLFPPRAAPDDAARLLCLRPKCPRSLLTGSEFPRRLHHTPHPRHGRRWLQRFRLCCLARGLQEEEGGGGGCRVKCCPPWWLLFL